MHTDVRQLGDAGEDVGEPSLWVDVVEPRSLSDLAHGIG